MKREGSFYVYILRLTNKSYYTGFTADLRRRLALHASGRASRLTRSFRPVCLAQCWRIACSRGEALRVEAFIKSRDRRRKEGLVRNPVLLADWLRREAGLALRPSPLDRRTRMLLQSF